MYTKSQFLSQLRDDTAIAKHLHAKLAPGDLDYRPAENMRSTLELLQYLTLCVELPARALIANDWSPELRQPLVDRSQAMTGDEFPARMDEQMRTVEGLLEPFSDDELRKREAKLPWANEPTTLGEALIGMPLRFLAAYRMQLFVYLKASGQADLNTYNCWMGIDQPPQS